MDLFSEGGIALANVEEVILPPVFFLFLNVKRAIIDCGTVLQLPAGACPTDLNG